MNTSYMRTLTLVTALLLTPLTIAYSQTCDRIMVQDSVLNNLVAPDDYKTAPLGRLGGVLKVGHGAQDMILIAGLGFGGRVFEEFMTAHEDEFTMYAVTLPGFDRTPAPPVPGSSTSFGEQTWTSGALEGIKHLIESEHIQNPIILGHWMTGTQLALRLALEHPDHVKAVILASGSACFVAGDTTKFPAHPPLAMRLQAIDGYMAPAWFKTVTRETWDDNNFLPGDYAVHPVRGLRLWRQAVLPPIHVWVRYLCEFYAQDISQQLDSLVVPTLLLKPGLENIYYDPGNNYLYSYLHVSWLAAEGSITLLTTQTVPNARICMWFDQPEVFDRAIAEFLGGL